MRAPLTLDDNLLEQAKSLTVIPETWDSQGASPLGGGTGAKAPANTA